MDDSCSVLPIAKLEGNVFHHEISTTFIKLSVNRGFLFLFFSKHLVGYVLEAVTRRWYVNICKRLLLCTISLTELATFPLFLTTECK